MGNFGIPVTIIVLFIAAMAWQGERFAAAEKNNTAILYTDSFASAKKGVWLGANKYQIPVGTAQGNLVWYGHALIANTAYYFGPKGTVSHNNNGMNCQNCHLEAGTLPFANNFGKVYATYPQYRARNNAIQGIYGRINDCFERSMNGKALDTNSTEMRAMYAYFKWLGEDVPKNSTPAGTVIGKLPYINRAANPVQGSKIYMSICSSCHGANGQGQPNISGIGYIYPPLWGSDSYNDGAGLYRLSSFAGYVKNNMPFGTNYTSPKLTDEEAWDVAAFVNSQPRPHKDQSMDWKNTAQKPVDIPFGPYADSFSEQQHKYGPFQPIAAANKKK
ncbi:MAG TPA: c-type cytochrome [Chitinophagaceae bacterium]|nr:c-type cytochrome [Chitinophagaceae bacterium]